MIRGFVACVPLMAGFRWGLGSVHRVRSHLQYQRVAAYAVIIREGLILLSRLAPSITPREMWTLPGGGIDFGEDPAAAVVREVHEETSLVAQVGGPIHIGSAQRVVDENVDMHSVRIVFQATVPADSPPPRVVEVAGSTIDARWHRLSDVLDRSVPLVEWARAAILAHEQVI